MPSLSELQRAFVAAVSGADPQPLLGHVRGEAADARLGVYRASIRENYRKALRAVYPVIEALVGERFFAHAADAYARAHPSRDGDLNRFGAQFADFLADFPGAAGLAYLSDTARLEWAMEEVFHAAPTPAGALETVAERAAAEGAVLRLALAPARRLLASRWPVHRLWALNQPGVAWDDGFDIDAGGVNLLVRRAGHEVVLEPLAADEFALLEALAAGLPLGEACAQALRVAPESAVGEALQRHLLAATLYLPAG